MVELAPFVDLVARVGPTGLLTIMIWLLMTGKLVTRGQYDDVKAQRDRLLDLALESQAIATKAVGVARGAGGRAGTGGTAAMSE